MKHLPLTWLLPLTLAACGSTTTPAVTADVSADSAADSSADAPADAVGDAAAVTPGTACKSDCDTQKQDCATIDLAQCYGLCDYVVPGLNSADCMAKQTAAWECEATVAWVCDPTQTVVGALKDPNACQAEHAARDVACPKSP